MVEVKWTPYLATPIKSFQGVQVKEKAPYFVLEKFILDNSPNKFGASNCKYKFKICKFYHVWKIKNFKVFPNG